MKELCKSLNSWLPLFFNKVVFNDMFYFYFNLSGFNYYYDSFGFPREILDH